MSKDIRKILVIQTGNISEFVLSLAAMKKIRQAHPRARITLLTLTAFEALAKSSAYFNAVEADGDLQGVGQWLALRTRIRSAGYDRVYDLTGSRATNLLFQLLRPFRPEWSGPAQGAKLRHRNPRRERMHLLERQAEQLQVAGIWPDAPTAAGEAPAPDLSWILSRAPAARSTTGSPAPRPFVLLVPGGSEKKPEKRWPIDNYATLATVLRRAGYDIVVIGGPSESGLARAIQGKVTNLTRNERLVGQVRDLTGRTDFAQIALLGARASLAVGNQTGPMHLIAAAGAPTLALSSSASDSSATSPRGHVTVVHAANMADLSVETVTNAVFSLIPRP